MENLFAKNLKMLRAEHAMSQSALAKKLGVTQQCVSEWELGRTEPTLSYSTRAWTRCADAMGLLILSVNRFVLSRRRQTIDIERKAE